MDGWQLALAYLALRKAMDDLKDQMARRPLAVPSARRRLRLRPRQGDRG